MFRFHPQNCNQHHRISYSKIEEVIIIKFINVIIVVDYCAFTITTVPLLPLTIHHNYTPFHHNSHNNNSISGMVLNFIKLSRFIPFLGYPFVLLK